MRLPDIVRFARRSVRPMTGGRISCRLQHPAVLARASILVGGLAAGAENCPYPVASLATSRAAERIGPPRQWTTRRESNATAAAAGIAGGTRQTRDRTCESAKLTNRTDGVSRRRFRHTLWRNRAHSQRRWWRQRLRASEHAAVGAICSGTSRLHIVIDPRAVRYLCVDIQIWGPKLPSSVRSMEESSPPFGGLKVGWRTSLELRSWCTGGRWRLQVHSLCRFLGRRRNRPMTSATGRVHLFEKKSAVKCNFRARANRLISG